MTIAELFVSIGVKGAEKATGALGKVKDGLSSIADSSLAAKAAVLAVIYGLERLTMMSADTGMELKKFGDFTGLSTDKLQRWQYALRQSGVSADETASTIKGIQSAIGQMQLGKGPPGGIGVIAQFTGGFDRSKINDTFYVMDKLRQFAQNKDVPTAFANEFLKSFGLGENAIQGLRRMTVDLNKVKPSFIYSTGEIQTLAKVQVAWDNLFAEMKMFSVRSLGGFGGEVVSGLTDAFHAIRDFSQIISTLIKQFPLLKAVAIGVGVAIAAAFAPITTLISGIIFGLSEIQKLREGRETTIGKFVKDNGAGIQKNLGEAWGSVKGLFSGNQSALATPLMSPAQGRAGGGQVISITQNITHHGDAKDTGAVKDSHKMGVRDAARQMQSQAQVN